MFNKNVAYLLIAQDRIALSALMEQCSEYKISFYAQGDSKPAAVIECKKSMNQKMTAEDLKSLNIKADSNKSYTCIQAKSHALSCVSNHIGKRLFQNRIEK